MFKTSGLLLGDARKMLRLVLSDQFKTQYLHPAMQVEQVTVIPRGSSSSGASNQLNTFITYEKYPTVWPIQVRDFVLSTSVLYVPSAHATSLAAANSGNGNSSTNNMKDQVVHSTTPTTPTGSNNANAVAAAATAAATNAAAAAAAAAQASSSSNSGKHNNSSNSLNGNGNASTTATKEKNAIFVITKSCTHPSRPERKGVVRAAHTGAWLFEQVDEHTVRYMHVDLYDMKSTSKAVEKMWRSILCAKAKATHKILADMSNQKNLQLTVNESIIKSLDENGPINVVMPPVIESAAALAAAQVKQCKRIIYTSQTDGNITNDMLKKLEQQCKKYNTANKITGVLLYGSPSAQTGGSIDQLSPAVSPAVSPVPADEHNAEAATSDDNQHHNNSTSMLPKLSSPHRHPNNPENSNIIHHVSVFYQVIEGEVEKVDNLFNKIKQDLRHRNCTLLTEELNIEGRWFDTWSMKHVDSESVDFSSAIAAHKVFKNMAEKTVIEESSFDSSSLSSEVSTGIDCDENTETYSEYS